MNLNKGQEKTFLRNSEELLKCFIRMMNIPEWPPGKKQYISIKIEGCNEHKQKELILVNLKELYFEFLKLGQPIGFSKFCQLCPKCCITVDSSSGVHSVYVCEIHQNCKLMAAALPSQVHYKMLLEKMACDGAGLKRRCQVCRFQVPGIRYAGLRCQVCRFQVSSVQVSGTRCTSFRCQVPGIKCTGFRFQEPGFRYQL